MIADNRPIKLTLGIIIGIIILFMGMKEVAAHSFPKGESDKVYETPLSFFGRSKISHNPIKSLTKFL